MIDRNRALYMDGQGRQLRIGAVSYLNSKPLVEGLAELCPEADLVLDYPSRLADGLAHRRLDVALIPSVEAFSDPNYEVVSTGCVATHGPVFSVKVFFRTHPGAVRTLALDEGSRTSAALARVMLDERFGVQPQLQKLPFGKSAEETEADAVLLIGDRAMSSPREQFPFVWDLGEEWVSWTGLPFVFAMWIGRKDAELGDLPARLNAARDLGLLHLDEIVQRESSAMDLPSEMVRHYFTRNLHFRIGKAEEMGLRLFQELAARHGLAQSSPLTFRTDLSRNTAPALVAAH